MDNVYNLTKLENCNIMELVSSLSTDAVTAGKKFEEVGIKLTKYTNENGDYHILKYIKSALTEDNSYSQPRSIKIKDEPNRVGRNINTNLTHLPSCQMIDYKPMPKEPKIKWETCLPNSS